MKIVVIGTGECFVEKMYPALKQIDGIEVSDIIDILPEKVIRKRLSKSNFTDFNYHRSNGTPNELDNILGRLDVNAVIESSPNKFHVPDATVVLNHGLNLYMEKPFAVNFDETKNFEEFLKQHPETLVYFGDYYRDEKGVALQVLTDTIPPFISDKFLRNKHGREINPGFYGGIEALGKINKIKGKILEGKGTASTINHRLWLGDKSQGGMFRDMFYHLATLVYLLEDKIGNIEILESKAGICEGARRNYEEKVGEEIAETYAHSLLKSSEGCEIELEAGKYTGSHERNFYIHGENGNITIDFEKENLIIDTEQLKDSIINISHPKYLLIIQQFKNLLNENPQHFMYENSKNALQLTLSVRDVANKFIYRRGEL